ncbi:MAG: NAD-dependent dehydratase, partial [Micromonosporaceae bacterium]|nr:NAD-dependent dehydratase [Micromonosporaceae bacterium]
VAALRVPDPPVGLRAYNIGSGKVTTVGELATTLSSVMHGPPPVITGEFRSGDVRHITASPARAARELGFRATVRLDDGLREFATAMTTTAMRG